MHWYPGVADPFGLTLRRFYCYLAKIAEVEAYKAGEPDTAMGRVAGTLNRILRRANR